jgi:hypothetical protein
MFRTGMTYMAEDGTMYRICSLFNVGIYFGDFLTAGYVLHLADPRDSVQRRGRLDPAEVLALFLAASLTAQNFI